ncbi:MAG TPA: hypothetical protein VFH95_08670 [Candidatus Kapabacteria bacterium]|nr:hypothetical protein [Candidatus Kapabacteria bacterium]
MILLALGYSFLLPLVTMLFMSIGFAVYWFKPFEQSVLKMFGITFTAIALCYPSESFAILGASTTTHAEISASNYLLMLLNLIIKSIIISCVAGLIAKRMKLKSEDGSTYRGAV